MERHWYFVGIAFFGMINGLFSQVPLPKADCSAQETTIAQLTGKIDRARTANRGAAQAQAAVEGALA